MSKILKLGSGLLNFIYPIGSIYMSVNSINPSNIFGGNWEQIKDKFLLSCGNTYSNGSMGGESSHTLSINEMPSHKHWVSISVKTQRLNGNPAWNSVVIANDAGTGITGGRIGTQSWSNSTNNAQVYADGNTAYSGGDNVSHNNMPPYLAVYMWKRIS